MFVYSLPHWPLKISSLFIFILFILSIPYGYAAEPLTCYVQANKDPAWSAYDVKLSMYDINTQKIFETFLLPQAKGNVPSVNSIKKAFDCQNHSLVSFLASYSPAIWQSDVNKQFIANITWNLAPQIVTPRKDVKDLTITINFPDNFINVPALLKSKDFIPPNQTKSIPAPTY